MKSRLELPDDPRPFERAQQRAAFVPVGEEVHHRRCQQTIPIGIPQHLHQRRVGVHDLPVTGDPEEPHWNVIEEALVTPLCLAQGLALPGPFQGQVHGRGQAGVVSGRLGDVIVQACLHHLHGQLLVAAAGEHDDRALRPPHFYLEQHAEAVGPAQLVVRNYQVQAGGFEGLGQLARISGLQELAVGKFKADLPPNQRPVVRVVVHDQDGQRIVHRFFQLGLSIARFIRRIWFRSFSASEMVTSQAWIGFLRPLRLQGGGQDQADAPVFQPLAPFAFHRRREGRFSCHPQIQRICVHAAGCHFYNLTTVFCSR